LKHFQPDPTLIYMTELMLLGKFIRYTTAYAQHIQETPILTLSNPTQHIPTHPKNITNRTKKKLHTAFIPFIDHRQQGSSP